MVFDHAEVRFDVVLYPMPDLHVSWKSGLEPLPAHPRDISVKIADTSCIAKLQRPHFLDQDLRLLFPADGNRAVLFTLVCQGDRPIFQGDMERQVFWWKKNRFPEMTDISAMCDMDGILIDIDGAHEKAENWQDRFAGLSEDIPFISFADVHMQRRWLMLTMPDDYAAKALNWI